MHEVVVVRGNLGISKSLSEQLFIVDHGRCLRKVLALILHHVLVARKCRHS